LILSTFTYLNEINFTCQIYLSAFNFGVLPQSLRDSSLKEGASVASLFEGGGFFAKAKKTEGVILHFAFCIYINAALFIMKIVANIVNIENTLVHTTS